MREVLFHYRQHGQNRGLKLRSRDVASFSFHKLLLWLTTRQQNTDHLRISVASASVMSVSVKALSFVCLPSSLLSYRKKCWQKVKWFYISKAMGPLNDLRGSHTPVTTPGWSASLWLTDITWWTGNQFDQMFLWIIVALANYKRLSP